MLLLLGHDHSRASDMGRRLPRHELYQRGSHDASPGNVRHRVERERVRTEVQACAKLT